MDNYVYNRLPMLYFPSRTDHGDLDSHRFEAQPTFTAHVLDRLVKRDAGFEQFARNEKPTHRLQNWRRSPLMIDDDAFEARRASGTLDC